jgi:hypothetical protein
MTMHPNADLLGTAELNYEQWRDSVTLPISVVLSRLLSASPQALSFVQGHQPQVLPTILMFR